MTEKRNIAQNLAEDEVLQWVTFQLENETHGINVMAGSGSVALRTEIVPVPGDPDYVLGIINLHGNVVTSRYPAPAFWPAGRGRGENSGRIVIIEAEKSSDRHHGGQRGRGGLSGLLPRSTAPRR